MSWEVPGLSFSLDAGANLTAHQFKFVAVGANGLAVLADDAADPVVGVLYNKPDVGQAATVVSTGVVRVLSGAAVTVGSRLKPDAQGRAVASAATERGFGIALTAAPGPNVLIAVLLTINANVD